MNSGLKYNSTEIVFTGDINYSIFNFKDSVNMRRICKIGIVLGVFLLAISAWIGLINIWMLRFVSISGCLFVCGFKITESSEFKALETQYNVCCAIKYNKLKGIEFEKSIETKESFCNVIFYIEDVKGNIESVTVPSVFILDSTDPKYQDLIEINLDGVFEITHYYYSRLTYNTIFK